MPTLNVCVQIYMNKKNTKFIKSTNISLLFRSFINFAFFIYVFYERETSVFMCYTITVKQYIYM